MQKQITELTDGMNETNWYQAYVQKRAEAILDDQLKAPNQCSPLAFRPPDPRDTLTQSVDFQN